MPTPYVLDYTSPRPDLEAMKAQGVVGIIRYLSHTAWKNITPAEYRAAKASGLEVALVWELGQTMVNSGFAGGLKDGKAAALEAESLGYPTGHVIYWACDEQPNPAILAQCLQYGKGFAIGCSWVARPYGNDQVVDAVVRAGIADKGWQCRAWSGTPPRKSIHRVLYQRTDHAGLTLPGDYDVNDILGDDWAALAPKPPTPTPPEDDDMRDPIILQAGPPGHHTGPVYLLYPASGVAVRMDTPADIDRAKAEGAVDTLPTLDGTNQLRLATAAEPIVTKP